MKKLLLFLCLIVAAYAIYLTPLPNFHQMIRAPSKVKESYAIQNQLQTFHPISEHRTFTFLVLANNAAEFCEKQLTSIFKQSYPHYKVLYLDNGSTDQTKEKVRAFSPFAPCENNLILVHYEHTKPLVEAVYKAIHNMSPSEIVIFLDGHDWLAHEHVLSHLNDLYANPDVWMTYSRGIHYPDYQKIGGRACSDFFLKEKRGRQEGLPTTCSLISFPAAYFKKIHLQDLLLDSQFVDEVDAFLYPLFEMGPQHVLFTDEVMLVKNDTKPSDTRKQYLHHVMAVDFHLSSITPYPSITGLDQSLDHPSHHPKKGDILIFSEDSPLHLYACLESLYAQVTGINEIHVIYQSHDKQLERAYLSIKSAFPGVQFMEVCDYPNSDFESLLEQTLANRRYGMPYLLVANDSHIFHQKLDLHTSVQALEKAHADCLFLLLEKNKESPLSTEPFYMGNGIFALQIGQEGLKQSPYMCIYRKAAMRDTMRVFNTPRTFTRFGKKHLPLHSIALFYQNRKALPIGPEKETSLHQKKEWGNKLIEGYKIDLFSLSAESKSKDYLFIKREKQPS